MKGKERCKSERAALCPKLPRGNHFCRNPGGRQQCGQGWLIDCNDTQDVGRVEHGSLSTHVEGRLEPMAQKRGNA